MSNIYDILGKIKSVVGLDSTPVEVTKEPVYESVEARGDIMEAVASLEEKYMGFKAVEKAAKAGGAKDPAAVAASIGRKKYGKKKFQKAAAAGKKLGEETVEESGGPYELYNPKHPKFAANYKKFKAKNPDAKLEDFIAAMKKKEHGVNEGVVDSVVNRAKEKYHDVQAKRNASKHAEIADWDKEQSQQYLDKAIQHRTKRQELTKQRTGSTYNGLEEGEYDPAPIDPEAVAKRKRLQALKDKAEDEGDIYAKEKNTPIRKVAGKAYGGAAQKDAPEADDLDEMTSSTGGEVTRKDNVTTHKGKKYGGEEEQDRREKDIMDRKSRHRIVDVGDDEDLDEVAPPGAKAERMVKHIKKGYAKDGKLTKREKGIAYATAWKAHNKGQVEEGVEFGDTIKNSEAKMTKAKKVKVTESRMLQEGDYFYEKIAKALAEKNPTLDTASGDFVTAVRQEMVAQGIEPNRARNIIMIDDDFISDVATSYGHYCQEVAECDAPLNSQLGGVEELDEIARLAGLPSQDEWKAARNAPATPAAPAVDPTKKSTFDKSKLNPMREDDYEEVNVEESPDTMDLDEDEMEEGNEFSGALAKAKAAGEKEFEVDGQKYTVKEDINVNISANGEEDSLNLVRKLAGMPIIAVTAPESEEVEAELEEEREVEHLNTPREETAGIDAAIPSGTDLNRSKQQDPATANKAANPLTVKEDELWKSYESMIGEIKQ